MWRRFGHFKPELPIHSKKLSKNSRIFSNLKGNYKKKSMFRQISYPVTPRKRSKRQADLIVCSRSSDQPQGHADWWVRDHTFGRHMRWRCGRFTCRHKREHHGRRRRPREVTGHRHSLRDAGIYTHIIQYISKHSCLQTRPLE